MNPNRGRGHAGGGGRGNGGGRWNGGGGFGPERGNNFFEGSSSGTAGQDEGLSRGSDHQGGGFDGVFRAGFGNYEGDRARFNNGSGYNRGADRRNFGSQGNYTYRRTNNGYNARDARNNFATRANNNAAELEGLTAEQSLLVKEAAAAFAKQLAEMSKQGGQPELSSAAATVRTDLNQVAAPTRQGSGIQRAEAALLLRFEVEGLQPPPVADVVMNEANNAEGDMEHDGQYGNNEHTDEHDVSKSGDKQDGNGDGTGKFSSTSVHGQTLAFSPIKFGVVGSEKIVNGEVLTVVPKSPNVFFSAQIDDILKKDACVRSLDPLFAAEDEEETQGSNISAHVAPLLSAVAGTSVIGPTSEGHGLAQPNMHGSKPVEAFTSIRAASDDHEAVTRSLVTTPVGVCSGGFSKG
ncbi:hypothetical protein ACQ4PT_066828 [Festuca glaucescens]